MLERLRNQIGTAGLVVAIVALVAALGGGAYAASGGLTGKQKKEVKAIAKSFQGTGPAGAAGPQGAVGAKGDTGSAGSNGTNGAPGATGATGKNGKDGSPWTVGGVLPSEETETGAWTFGPANFPEDGSEVLRMPISFTLPLPAPLDVDHVHFLVANGKEAILNGSFEPEEVTSTQCLGTVAVPSAEPGNLCIYTKSVTANVLAFSNYSINAAGLPDKGASVSGAFVEFNLPLNATGSGTWAVTAP